MLCKKLFSFLFSLAMCCHNTKEFVILFLKLIVTYGLWKLNSDNYVSLSWTACKKLYQRDHCQELKLVLILVVWKSKIFTLATLKILIHHSEPKVRFKISSYWTNFPAMLYKSCLLRKEVIQPHLPIRLPCYDFTPIIGPTFGDVPLAVRLSTSGVADSHGVTGGVYKARERIHGSMLTCHY